VDYGPACIAYLKFDLTILSGKRITSAALTLNVNNPSNPTGGLQNIRYVTSSWSCTGTAPTYNTKPTMASGTPIATFSKSTTGVVTVDMKTAVAANTGKILSIGIDSTNSDGLDFYSKEYTTNSYRPQLVITYY
jgi:hypothetical protein